MPGNVDTWHEFLLILVPSVHSSRHASIYPTGHDLVLDNLAGLSGLGIRAAGLLQVFEVKHSGYDSGDDDDNL